MAIKRNLTYLISIICLCTATLLYLKFQKSQSVTVEQNKPAKLLDSNITTASTGKSLNNRATKLNKQGISSKQNGKFNDAIKYFDKAIEIDPRYSVALVNRAYTQIILSEYNEAIQDSSRAIEISPEFSDAYIARGWAYHFLEKDSLSLSDAKKAIE